MLASAGVSRVTDLAHAAQCNKAPFMYEMKGALFGYAAPARPVADRLVPVPPVSRLRRTSLAAFPAAPTRLGRIPRLPVSRSPGFPASPFPDHPVPRLPVSGSPSPSLTVTRSAGSSLTVPGSPGFPGSPFPDHWFQLHRFRIGRFPASPVRAVRLPVRPGATRRPPVPSTRGKYRFPGLSRAPG